MWWIAFGVVTIIALRRVVPIFASMVGMALIVAVLIWGYFAYAAGHAIGILGPTWELPAPLFFGLLLLWFGLEARTLVSEIRMRDLSRKLQESQPGDDEIPR